MKIESLPSVADILARAAAQPGAQPLPESIDLYGWNSDHPVFDRLVAESRPKVIIEVGTWKGRSTQHLALASAELMGVDEGSEVAIPAPSKIYCVDTWLGGIDHFCSDLPQDDLMRDAWGAPRLYLQFLKNFADEPDFARRTFPIQNTSLNGARILQLLGVSAQLIYIDGSHEYQDVFSDLCAYVQLLTPGGIIFGDDFRSFPDVFAAVLRFAHEYGFKVEEVERNYWILRRPA